jgi:hypothetical protein
LGAGAAEISARPRSSRPQSSAIAGFARGWNVRIRYGYAIATARTSLLRPSTGSGGNQANRIAPSTSAPSWLASIGLARRVITSSDIPPPESTLSTWTGINVRSNLLPFCVIETSADGAPRVSTVAQIVAIWTGVTSAPAGNGDATSTRPTPE